MDLAKEHLSDKHVLCPGLLGVMDLQSELGYIPETVRLINGPVTTVHSKRCKIWHIPARNLKSKADESDPRRQRVCGECLISDRYVTKAIPKKREMESSKRHERQQPSSNYPIIFHLRAKFHATLTLDDSDFAWKNTWRNCTSVPRLSFLRSNHQNFASWWKASRLQIWGRKN